MFEKLKQWFSSPAAKTEETKKEIVLCVHGFGRRLSHEFDNFVLWNVDYEFVTFNIYDLKDKDDCKPEMWIKRCEKKMEEYVQNGYKVSLIGFSMGGVLATHLASKYPCERLFLISPAFDYVHIANIWNTALKMFKKTPEEEKNKPSIPTGFTQCFMDVVRLCKDDIKEVTCPVCFVHGDSDETIPLRSSLNAYAKVPHEKKKVFVIHEGKHRMMLHKNTCWETYQLFLLFQKGQILGDVPLSYAKDIFEEKKIYQNKKDAV